MTQPTHTDTLRTLIAEIDARPHAAADDRIRAILTIMVDMLVAQDAAAEKIVGLDKRVRVLDAILRNLAKGADEAFAARDKEIKTVVEIINGNFAEHGNRLRTLEEWRETTQGDGR